jgi:serine/threonine protein kinase/TPR repeat protein
MTDESPASNPASIGRYQVIRTLGEGGMGAVYLATDPAIDRKIALKLMRAGFNTGSLRERFAREARAVGRLHHPNIVTIFEFGEHQGEPFIAMEYVEGETLSSLIGRSDVSLGQIVGLMDGLCAGLHYAHRAGIIHRDIKPVNVMVDTEGIVKILDFGIARAAALSLTQAGTQPGTVLGTLNYMSPEQLSGKAVDQRTDIFAVGAVFYELLAGRQAFPGDIDSGILQLILLTGPTPLAQVRPDLDPGLLAIVNRCLERDVERRYPDLGAMRKDLAVFQHTDTAPRSAGATVILTPGASPSAIRPADLPTPSPATRAAAEQARLAELDAQITEARAALDREEYTRATESCQQVLSVEPSHSGALALQAQLSTVLQARSWLADGQAEFNRGSLTTATALVDRALGVRPAMPEGLRLRAAIEEARARTQVSSTAPTMLVTPSSAGTAGTHAVDSGATIILPRDQPFPTRGPGPSPATGAPAPAGTGVPAVAPAVAAPRSSSRWIGLAAAAVVVVGLGAFLATRLFVSKTPDGGSEAPPAAGNATAVAPPSSASAAEPAPVPPTTPPTSSAPPPTVGATSPPSPGGSSGQTGATASPPVTPVQTPTPNPAGAPGTASVAAKPADVPAPAPPSPPPPPTADSRPAPVPADAGNPVPPDSTAGPRSGGGRLGRQDATGSAVVMTLAGAQRGCNLGNAHACTQAGLAYRNGRGTARDDATAAKFYQRACDGGDAFGCVDLGQMYGTGTSVTRDDARAAALYQKGCDGNAPMGCAFLGVFYQMGRAVPHDEARALSLFAKSCDGNNLQGCNDGAMLLENAKDVPRGDPRAVGWLTKSCDGGFLLGCRNLGSVYAQGRGVPRDPVKALALYQRSCDGGNVAACNDAGMLLQNALNLPRDDTKAAALLTTACDGGYLLGCRNLGVMNEQGRGMPKNEAQARALYQRGCDARLGLACTNLGDMFENGHGVPKSSADAKAFYTKACEYGDQNGCRLKGGG